MIPMRFMWQKLIRNMILFFSVFVMVFVKSRGNLAKKIISKSPLFSSVISGILEKIQEWAGDYDYILAFPTAGGHMQEDHLDGVLFDHLMLEGEQKAHISNYSDLTTLLSSADLKWEVPHDMVSGFGFTWRLMRVLLRQLRVRENWKIQNRWL